METEKILMTCLLGDGLQAVVRDDTAHYFGGYYHVRIEVRADVPVCPACFDSEEDHRTARTRLGDSVRFSRRLEKMAVLGSEVDSVRCELLASFEANLLPYLQRPDFPRRFVQTEYSRSLAAPGIRRW